MFATTTLTSSTVARQKELQRQISQKPLQEHYPSQKLYLVKRRRKAPFSKLVLPLADTMISAGYQLKERHQPA